MMKCIPAFAIGLLALSAAATSLAQPPAKKQVEPHARKKAGDEAPAVKVGDKVPSFVVVNLEGKSESLADLQKDPKSGQPRPIVLTFWCSFCDSCRGIDQPLDKLAAEYKGKATVVAIDASAPDSAADIKAFVTEHKLTLPVVVDKKGAAADLFGAHVTTTTVVIDAAGTLRYRGRFSQADHSFAAEALKAVLDGKDVHTKETKPRG